MRVFSIISLILGLICAFIQINDPDPYVWIIIYFQLVILAILHLQSHKPVWYAALITVLFALGFLMFTPDLIQWVKEGMPSVVESMKAESQYIELVREGGGMLICLMFAFVFFYNWFKEKNRLY